jgi:hypothetical protein
MLQFDCLAMLIPKLAPNFSHEMNSAGTQSSVVQTRVTCPIPLLSITHLFNPQPLKGPPMCR